MRNFPGPILNEQLTKLGSYLRFDNSSKTYDVFTRANSVFLFKQGILQKKNTLIQKTVTRSPLKRN